MKPSPELDALVAEKVMGLPPIGRRPHAVRECEDPFYSTCVNCGLSERGIEDFNRDDCEGCPRYSTDISAAWEVVEKLGLSVLRLENGWQARRYVAMRDECSSDADTAPHAICLAALRAKGVEVG